MARFLTCFIDPHTGRERLGTESQQYHEYASVQNVIRFGLRKPGILAGQHNIYFAPKDSMIERFICTAYKLATSSTDTKENNNV